ncbi:MAG: hypothetical protein OXS29_02655 [bacterium]|nr:hypothetical protein [bacterium]MDE0287651.1 hypothetical protein [bacterium]MDE0438410.1 hypothetical protein [bacterium]
MNNTTPQAALIGLACLLLAGACHPNPPETATTATSTVSASTSIVTTSTSTTVAQAGLEEPEQRPVGWFDVSDDRFYDTILWSNSQDQLLTIGCYTDRPDRDTWMRFDFEPFPDENVGYSLELRYTFFTGTEHGLSHTGWTWDFTTDLYEALTTEDTLIYEAHATRQPDPDAALETSLEGNRWEGETEWQTPPAVYLNRGVFDLTVNREVLTAVLERCGQQPSQNDSETP